MDEESKKAFINGYYQAQAGQPNPYPIGSNQWVKWMMGRRQLSYDLVTIHMLDKPIANDNHPVA